MDIPFLGEMPPEVRGLMPHLSSKYYPAPPFPFSDQAGLPSVCVPKKCSLNKSGAEALPYCMLHGFPTLATPGTPILQPNTSNNMHLTVIWASGPHPEPFL